MDSEEFDKAEEFCLSKDKSSGGSGTSGGLITTLLSIYFEYY